MKNFGIKTTRRIVEIRFGMSKLTVQDEFRKLHEYSRLQFLEWIEFIIRVFKV